jgi:hypothetical protein
VIVPAFLASHFQTPAEQYRIYQSDHEQYLCFKGCPMEEKLTDLALGLCKGNRGGIPSMTCTANANDDLFKNIF